MKFLLHRASQRLTDESAPASGAVKDGDDWKIDIPDLDALMAFVAREGQLVINQTEIWIYDDYME